MTCFSLLGLVLLWYKDATQPNSIYYIQSLFKELINAASCFQAAAVNGTGG